MPEHALICLKGVKVLAKANFTTGTPRVRGASRECAPTSGKLQFNVLSFQRIQLCIQVENSESSEVRSMGGGNVHVVQTKVEWDQKLKEAGSKPVSTMSSA